MDKLVEKIAEHFFTKYCFRMGWHYDKWEDEAEEVKDNYRHKAREILQAILSDPTICEIDPDAELPENPYCLETEYAYHEGAEHYKSLLANWRKVIK